MTSLSTLVGFGGKRGMGKLLEEDTCTVYVTFSKKQLWSPFFLDSDAQDLLQSFSFPFQGHETVHTPPQAEDEALSLVQICDAGIQEGMVEDREVAQKVEEKVEVEEDWLGGLEEGEAWRGLQAETWVMAWMGRPYCPSGYRLDRRVAACLRLEPCHSWKAEVGALYGVEVGARWTLEPPEAPAEPSAQASSEEACSP